MLRPPRGHHRELLLELVEKLYPNGLPFKIVQVVGTNGKGSTAIALSSILDASGQRVGLFTSPHISSPSERIAVDGRAVELGIVEDAIWNLASEDSRFDDLSFFEAMLLGAIKIFTEEGVDIAVLEAGIGGIKDATSFVGKRDLTVLTSVGIDHQKQLGGSLGSIATNKIGQVEKGGELIVGLIPDEALSVVERHCSENGVKLSRLGESFEIFDSGYDGGWTFVQPGKSGFDIRSPTLGVHQRSNMAIAATTALKLGASESNCQLGIERVKIPGRIELVYRDNIEFILDGAHNEEAFESLISFLDSDETQPMPIIISARSKGRLKLALELFSPYAQSFSFISPQPGFSLDDSGITDGTLIGGVPFHNYGQDLDTLYSKIVQGDPERVLAIGSFYLVGALKIFFGDSPSSLW